MNEAIVTAATPTFVVAVDCAHPHQLATFLAAALHYEVEDNHEQVLQMIELGSATRDDARGDRRTVGVGNRVRGQRSGRAAIPAAVPRGARAEDAQEPGPPRPAFPAGRFDLRYWDGSTWTEHVSRAGQQFTDPPDA